MLFKVLSGRLVQASLCITLLFNHSFLIAWSSVLSNNISSSTAKKPDLDWSQVRETINMLTLAVSQVECTMTDGEKSITELTQSFTYIASQLKDVINNHDNTPPTEEQDPTKLKSMKLSAVDIHQQIMNAIVAFQFYDRLSQRLDHVKRDLGWLSELVSDSSQLYNPSAWSKLQEDIMSNYSMEEERIMFQHIMNGASVEEALEIYQHHFINKKDDTDDTTDEVELF